MLQENLASISNPVSEIVDFWFILSIGALDVNQQLLSLVSTAAELFVNDVPFHQQSGPQATLKKHLENNIPHHTLATLPY